MSVLQLGTYKERLLESLDEFPKARIIVVGDIILDRYIWGDVSRISPEAPVPIVDVRRETKMLGGAANVINNLASLGADPVLCGVLGEDESGEEVLCMLKELGLTTEAIFMEKGRDTSMKTRVIAHNQQVVRFDKETKQPIGEKAFRGILDLISGFLEHTDIILISDYGKGVVSRQLVERLEQITQRVKVPIAVDPKTGNFPCYQGVDIITPNHEEAGAYCRFNIEDDGSVLKAGRMIMEELACGSVLITRGKDGMTLFEKGGAVTHVPAVAKEVYDVTGAGDTVIATLCMGLAAGLDLVCSAIMANFAGGIVVGKVGTSVVRPEELKAAIINHKD